MFVEREIYGYGMKMYINVVGLLGIKIYLLNINYGQQIKFFEEDF